MIDRPSLMLQDSPVGPPGCCHDLRRKTSGTVGSSSGVHISATAQSCGYISALHLLDCLDAWKDLRHWASYVFDLLGSDFGRELEEYDMDDGHLSVLKASNTRSS